MTMGVGQRRKMIHLFVIAVAGSVLSSGIQERGDLNEISCESLW